MHGLDAVPWHSLQHAYGTADDVPELIRRLQTADSNANGEDSPLWHLFGNIWHQGTVYEATSYAVPFLIQLVENAATPDRVGILGLLAAIAHGSSYLDVHESFLQRYPVEKIGIPGTEEFEFRKSKELEWVQAARRAVAQGYDIYAQLFQSQSDVAYAAANVLACLRTQPGETCDLLLGKLREESRSRYRAGLILLLGELRHVSPEVFDAVTCAASSEFPEECRAAAVAAVRLKSFEMTDDVREALVAAICDTDLHQHFEGLPWDTHNSIDQCALLSRDDLASRMAVDRLLNLVETGCLDEEPYDTLCQLLFKPVARLVPGNLSVDQQRALKAIVSAIEIHGVVFHTHFPCYGLPDSRRALRKLAAGQPADGIVDESLPVIGDSSNPMKPRALRTLRPGDRIHSRYFGHGTVQKATPREDHIELVIDFDEEGRHTLGLTESPIRYVGEFVRYLCARLIRRRQP